MSLLFFTKNAYFRVSRISMNISFNLFTAFFFDSTTSSDLLVFDDDFILETTTSPAALDEEPPSFLLSTTTGMITKCAIYVLNKQRIFCQLNDPTSDWKNFHSICLASSFFLFHKTKGFFKWVWKPSLTPNSPLSLLPEPLISKNSTHGRFFPLTLLRSSSITSHTPIKP